MYYFLAVGIDVFSAAIILLPATAILFLTIFHHTGWVKKILLFLFALYLAAMFSVVGAPAINTVRAEFTVNLVPILDVFNAPVPYLVNTVLNIILFIPVGFLLPLCQKQPCSWKKTVLWGLGLSLLIEFMQLFNARITDIDDLLTNTLGTYLGYGIMRRLPERWREKIFLSGSGQNRFVLPTMSAMVFLTMFFVTPFITGSLWRLMI